MIRQRTLKNIIRATGVGLHTGEKIYLSVRPAPANTGIVFIRTDLEPWVELPARVNLVGETRFATRLERDGVRVGTVEHLMAALCGLGIDNAIIEVSAPEIPIMDGSAAPYVFLLQSAGIEEQSASRRFIRILRRVRWADEQGWAELRPHDGFKVGYQMDGAHPGLTGRCHSAELDLARECFVREVSRARTFGYLQEFERLQELDLAPGGNLDKAVVVDRQEAVGGGSLRYRDEFVRHRILDAIGDLYLLGHPLVGEFRGHGSDHGTHHGLLRALLTDRSAWELAVADDGRRTPVATALRPALGQI